jgi:hypothetical protein
MTTAKQPKGLQTRGRAFWKLVTTKYALEPDEAELLVEVCRLLDLVDRLEAEDPTGAGLSRARGMLGRLLAQLALPDSGVVSATTARATKANAARWSQPQTGTAVSDAARKAASARWHGNAS